jgi:hypothetical protein
MARGTQHCTRPLSLSVCGKCTVSATHLVAFHHASLGAPAIATLEKALSLNYITGFPVLTVDTLRKHAPTTSIPMIKGHMDQSRKNQRSTAPISAAATIIPFGEYPCTYTGHYRTAASDHSKAILLSPVPGRNRGIKPKPPSRT